MQQSGNLIKQTSKVLTCADSADRTGENVVEYQRGYRQSGHEMPHRITDDDIDAAANEHAAALQVHGTYSETEQHHSEDEPRSGPADRLLGDTTGIKCG